MKKLTAILLVAAMAATLAFSLGCAQKNEAPMRIAALKGPTGMGVAYMASEQTDRYAVEIFDAPDAVTGRFISGEIDVAAVPINLASALYNKTDGNVVMLCVDTLGVLYIVDTTGEINALSDLAGKTVYATGEGSTPQYVLEYVLNQSGFADQTTVSYVGEHAALATMLASGEVDIGMLPEPNVTAVTLKNDDARVAIDLNDAWMQASKTQLVQGCYIASKTYYDSHRAQVEAFLSDYAASVDRVNSEAGAGALIAALGVLPSEAIAQNAIPRSNIVCVTGDEMRSSASAVLDVLFAANPKSVGGALPKEDFYAS